MEKIFFGQKGYSDFAIVSPLGVLTYKSYSKEYWVCFTKDFKVKEGNEEFEVQMERVFFYLDMSLEVTLGNIVRKIYVVGYRWV